MLDEVWQDIKAFGGLPFYLIITLVFLIMYDYYVFFALVLGLILSYVVTIGIRLVYFKQRPQKVKYKNLIQKVDASSFPSLHTIRVVVLGLILMVVVSRPLFSLLVIPFVLLSAYARVKLKRHHLSDVIAGIFLGVVIALFSLWISNILFL